MLGDSLFTSAPVTCLHDNDSSDDDIEEVEEVEDDENNNNLDRLDKEQTSEKDLTGTISKATFDSRLEEEHNALVATLMLLHHQEIPKYNWLEQQSVRAIPGFSPQGNTGPRSAPLENAVDYFQLFYTVDILQFIVQQTNNNAQHKLAKKKELKKTTQNEGQDKKKKEEIWEDLTVPELRAYLGVQVLIELLYKDRLESLWSKSSEWPLIQPAVFTKVFPRDRFMQITRYLHFCEEIDIPNRSSADYDKLYKIRPLLDRLRDNFQKEYVPDQNISVDECMVPFRGRLGFKQYCKDKPVKFGVKVFMLAEAKSGYNFNFEVYVGKESNIEMGLCSRVVISLCQPLFDKGYHIYTDRFYTSPLLLNYLKSVGLGGCGTVLPNRKNFPKELIRTTAEMNRGDYDFRMCGETGQVATVWCDQKPIYFLSNIHMSTYPDLTVKRKDGRGNAIDIAATPCVVEYNKHMGGVDLNDRFAKIDKCRKEYKWFKKLFRKSIMWSMYNAYIIERELQEVKPGRSRDFRSFALDVAHQLVGTFSARKRIGKRSSSNRSSHKRITDSDHTPRVSRNKDLRCAVCSEKHNRDRAQVRSKTVFICASINCDVPLCIKPDSTCWDDWHTKIEFWH